MTLRRFLVSVNYSSSISSSYFMTQQHSDKGHESMRLWKKKLYFRLFVYVMPFSPSRETTTTTTEAESPVKKLLYPFQLNEHFKARVRPNCFTRLLAQVYNRRLSFSSRGVLKSQEEKNGNSTPEASSSSPPLHYY